MAACRTFPEAHLVVGDTPNDVACAQAGRRRHTRGRATGGFTVEQLRESGADIVFQDMEQDEGS